jgi:hypothetical protein
MTSSTAGLSNHQHESRKCIDLVLRSSSNSAMRLVMGVFHGQKIGEI